jgi:hypothetical protein
MKLLQTGHVFNSLLASSEMLQISFSRRLAMGLSLSRILLNLVGTPAPDACKCKQCCAISNKSYLLAIARSTEKQCTRFPGWLSCILYQFKYKVTSDQITKLVVIIINMEYV